MILEGGLLALVVGGRCDLIVMVVVVSRGCLAAGPSSRTTVGDIDSSYFPNLCSAGQFRLSRPPAYVRI